MRIYFKYISLKKKRIHFNLFKERQIIYKIQLLDWLQKRSIRSQVSLP